MEKPLAWNELIETKLNSEQIFQRKMTDFSMLHFHKAIQKWTAFWSMATEIIEKEESLSSTNTKVKYYTMVWYYVKILLEMKD